jgi:hypothetical protein
MLSERILKILVFRPGHVYASVEFRVNEEYDQGATEWK